MNLKPPHDIEDLNSLRRWCEELYDFLKLPAFPAGILGYEETLTTDGDTLTEYGASKIDSSSNKVDCTLGSGTYVGQIKTVVMTEASNASDLSVTNHVTSDPEVFTFDAVDEALVLCWTGTEWATIYSTATT
jgi:hypothetical protein